MDTKGLKYMNGANEKAMKIVEEKRKHLIDSGLFNAGYKEGEGIYRNERSES